MKQEETTEGGNTISSMCVSMCFPALTEYSIKCKMENDKIYAGSAI